MSFFLVSMPLAIVVGVLRYRSLLSAQPVSGGRPIAASSSPAPVRARRRVVIDKAA